MPNINYSNEGQIFTETSTKIDLFLLLFNFKLNNFKYNIYMILFFILFYL
jgi:hypothetical protein